MTTILIVVVFWGCLLLIPFALNTDLFRKPRAKRSKSRAKRAGRGTYKIRARADHQHELWLAGDERGLYGDYPPADL